MWVGRGRPFLLPDFPMLTSTSKGGGGAFTAVVHRSMPHPKTSMQSHVWGYGGCVILHRTMFVSLVINNK